MNPEIKNYCVAIPAVKKNVAFTDDLVKKLAGVSLIQRAIDKAREISEPEHIYIITDSEEICLICKRNNVRNIYDPELKLEFREDFGSIGVLLGEIVLNYGDVIILSPYSPLQETSEIIEAYTTYKEGNFDSLLPVLQKKHKLFHCNPNGTRACKIFNAENGILIEVSSFQILSCDHLKGQENKDQGKLLPYRINHESIEISSYQDWWICEKLLKRKRIVFRIIGDPYVGMGNIFRSLALAHEITDHEIRFVCDEESRIAANKLAGYDYWLGCFNKHDILANIIDLKPDLVINDILDTSREYILALREQGIRVVNFEDLGSGASLTNLTINELYGEQKFQGKNVFWGHDYFFLRDEFNDAASHSFSRDIDGLLLTFGGTDYNDFTRKIFAEILPVCQRNKIKIYVVTGEGYSFKEEFKEEIADFGNDEVEFIYATGIMSSVMEKTQVAIVSNGRTLYELAHMNIPAIVLPHHEREKMHQFGCKENGFVNVGLYQGSSTRKKVGLEFEKLIMDHEHRLSLFNRMKAFGFTDNKDKVVDMVLNLLED
jgi:spore coat polysaccharide biosynthesis predicted glycosyltransferase SpsG/CMP-N-acetylneuraminic acid synthetase